LSLLRRAACGRRFVDGDLLLQGAQEHRLGTRGLPLFDGLPVRHGVGTDVLRRTACAGALAGRHAAAAPALLVVADELIEPARQPKAQHFDGRALVIIGRQRDGRGHALLLCSHDSLLLSIVWGLLTRRTGARRHKARIGQAAGKQRTSVITRIV
jgi:hypothetical protein